MQKSLKKKETLISRTVYVYYNERRYVEFEISIFQAIEILLQFKQRALSLRLTDDSNVTVYIACIWFML